MSERGESPTSTSAYTCPGFRKPFVPPSSATPLVVRSIDYAGEKHPATVKRTVVVPVAYLPLKNEAAIHKAKLLAGVRWSEEPPKGSGMQGGDEEAKHGYIKVSCEDFPQPSMNLKWISDVIDMLLAEANASFLVFLSTSALLTTHLG